MSTYGLYDVICMPKRELRQEAKLGATHRGKAWTKATKAVEDMGPRL